MNFRLDSGKKIRACLLTKPLLAVWFFLLCFPGIHAVHAQLDHGDEIVTVVGTNRVRVRTHPVFRKDGKDTFIRWINRGAQLKRIGKRGDWYEVSLSDGIRAWVNQTYAKEGIARDLLEVRPNKLNVRQKPSTRAGIVSRVSRGDLLSVVEKSGVWYLVMLQDGKRGYIREDLVTLRPLNPKKAIVSTESIGKPEPKPAPEPAQAEGSYFEQGKRHLAEGNSKQAIEAFKQEVERRPRNSDAHFELAKLLQASADVQGAIDHFRQSMRGDRSKPEAKFYIDALLEVQADTLALDPSSSALLDEEKEWTTGFLGNATYVLPGAAIGALLFLIVLGLVFRRKRASRMGRPAYKRRTPDAGFDSILKYAVEKRPLLRAIEQAEEKRAEMDEALQQRFDAFGKESTSGSPKLPAVVSTEALMKRVEALRKTIVSQEERAQIYADLVVLQNEKIDALDEEIEALKKLIKMDYAEKAKQPASGKSAKPGQ